MLFDHANGWLVGHKVLLPGVTVLERFIAEVRSRMESRLWRLLARDVTDVQRIEIVRGLGIKLPGTHVPPSRGAALARFANTVKVSAVARLPDVRRIATLVAFIHSLEASAHDDALDV